MVGEDARDKEAGGGGVVLEVAEDGDFAEGFEARGDGEGNAGDDGCGRGRGGEGIEFVEGS